MCDFEECLNLMGVLFGELVKDIIMDVFLSDGEFEDIYELIVEEDLV